MATNKATNYSYLMQLLDRYPFVYNFQSSLGLFFSCNAIRIQSLEKLVRPFFVFNKTVLTNRLYSSGVKTISRMYFLLRLKSSSTSDILLSFQYWKSATNLKLPQTWLALLELYRVGVHQDIPYRDIQLLFES